MPGTSRDFGPPRRFTPTLRGYAETFRDRARFVELYPESDVTRVLPTFYGNGANGDEIRPEFLRAAKSRSPAAGVGVIEGGRVLTNRGTVIAPPDEFIADVSDAWTSGEEVIYPIFLSSRLPRVTKIDETVAVLTSHCSWSNYGHWLGDTIPRLHLLQKSGIQYDKIVVPYFFDYQREALDALGLDRAKMITEPDLHLEARRVVVPTFPGVYGEPPFWALRYLRETFLPHARPGTARRRILISRNKPGATRRILNEEALFAQLRPFGVERIFPEELSFADEVSLFNDAELVIGACGAGMSNLVWCRPGTAVIEIFSPRYVSAFNWMIADHLDLNYAYALGKDSVPPVTADDRGIYEDITADIEEIFGLVLLLCRP